MMPKLNHISIELTRNCNCCCPGCFIPKNSQEIPTEDIFSFLEKNLHYVKNHCCVTGGEVTLREDLPQIIDFIHSHNKKVVMISNGSWKPELLDRIHPDEVKLSLDFPDERHDRWRGLQGLSRNIKYSLVPAIKDSGVPLKLLCTLQNKNLFLMDEMADLSDKLGVKVIFIRYVPSSINDNLNLSQEELKEALERVRHYKEDGRNIGWFGGLGCFTGDPYFCTAGINKLHVRTDGRVSDCMYNLSKTYGTIDENVEDIHKRTMRARERYEQRVIEQCSKCERYDKECAGDCLAIADVYGSVRGQCWV